MGNTKSRNQHNKKMTQSQIVSFVPSNPLFVGRMFYTTLCYIIVYFQTFWKYKLMSSQRWSGGFLSQIAFFPLLLRSSFPSKSLHSTTTDNSYKNNQDSFYQTHHLSRSTYTHHSSSRQNKSLSPQHFCEHQQQHSHNGLANTPPIYLQVQLLWAPPQLGRRRWVVFISHLWWHLVVVGLFQRLRSRRE